jgi:hypothetical protein
MTDSTSPAANAAARPDLPVRADGARLTWRGGG